MLLIACANVANLLLVRASSREGELVVRTALGADRGRLIGQLTTESQILSVVGSAIGVFLAAWTLSAIVAFGPRGLPRINEIAIDGRGPKAELKKTERPTRAPRSAASRTAAPSELTRVISRTTLATAVPSGIAGWPTASSPRGSRNQ